MAFTSITQAEIAAGQPVTQALMQKIKDNDDYLYSQVGAGGGGGEGGIPNGSFEIDADADGVPDGWTKNLYPAGGGALESTSPGHGAKAYKFIQQAGPGNGGGYLDLNDYLSCSPFVPLILEWLHYASVAGMHNLVQVRWFDKGQVYLSTTDVYNSTANPTSWTRAIGVALPPSSARFFKLRIIGGYTDTDIAGTYYFDGFSVLSSIPAVVHPVGIAEGYTSNNYWTEGGSVNITLPALSANSVVRFTIRGQFKLSAGNYAYQRFGIGTSYSLPNRTIYSGYEYWAATLLVRGLTGAQTLVQQLYVENGGGAQAFGKVDAGDITWEILSP